MEHVYLLNDNTPWLNDVCLRSNIRFVQMKFCHLDEEPTRQEMIRWQNSLILTSPTSEVYVPHHHYP